MTINSKYDIGERLVIGDLPCIVTKITFDGSAVSYDIEWPDVMMVKSRYMTETELDSAIAIQEEMMKNAEKYRDMSPYKAMINEWIHHCDNKVEGKKND